ncbi:DUF4132 domain-containing protein [Streptomyces sp. KL116D]|uniref:DUF4132 domain-containing protein n=1 Tax=Streptomyces sp. KL116D TaxID=3045152 RepID=UPI0035580300
MDGRRHARRIRGRRPADPHGRPGGGRHRGHPLAPRRPRAPAEIVAWRDWLERHAITQPFKQAHREVYLLTDAERTTGTYSNRFAAHIVRQHQFHSLAAVRGWRSKLRLCVDDEAPPATRELPQWGLRAEYWIEGDGEGTARTPPSPAAICGCAPTRSASTRSAPRRTRRTATAASTACGCSDGADPVEPLPLTDVPPLVLSESPARRGPVRGRGQCGQRPDVAGRRPRRPVPRVLGVVRLR